ncbi:MAG TPA: single-stranded DNA-binding protein [Gemmatimonas aurantiaca]|uniref:Single-stranded DNA-binding protein n=2 Tax=Gemmatimonas aurantiaca TaxID=173480 RepID=C1A431_GEMAT|nr:single-stranded DNA-binding protein [Gemmatimonas aurantiaca]BAH38856.1 single-strand binding protein [Gemmatimonas aurantiaca T-27]HCT57259.1 single-stranded DNA-binding protein [Gemmatimonas aurantiaca]
MSRSKNLAILIGNVGQDPEVRTVGTGGRVAQFSLATGKQWTDAQGNKQDATQWHRCVAWNQGKYTLADIVEKYVRKGEKIYVEGEIEYRQWQDKDGQTRYTTEIRVRELMLLGGKSEGGEVKQERPAKTTRPNTTERADDFPAALMDDDDSSLPF